MCSEPSKKLPVVLLVVESKKSWKKLSLSRNSLLLENTAEREHKSTLPAHQHDVIVDCCVLSLTSPPISKSRLVHGIVMASTSEERARQEASDAAYARQLMQLELSRAAGRCVA